MSLYSKEKRKEIYLKTIDLLDDIDCSLGLCLLLTRDKEVRLSYYRSVEYYNITDFVICNFPEFGLFTPDSYEMISSWWDHNKKGNDQRKIVLEFCIAMCD